MSSNIGLNPNMLADPRISPPFPLWQPTTQYYLGDVVSYAGQNWVCIFFADNSTQATTIGDTYPPDAYPITLNPVPGCAPGVYNPIATDVIPANTNGGSWINLTLATPPAPVWSPSQTYATGDVVMYPPSNPGTYWRASQPSFNQIPSLPYFDPSATPPRIAPQYWEQLIGTAAPSGLPATSYLRLLPGELTSPV